MAQAAVQDDKLMVPDGGIADFYMEDEELEALERQEADEAFGKTGIAEFGDVAARMASYGRGGDDTIAHVASGEIVIPLPLIENNPKMKESIFNHLRELGVENPEQYVVGSSSNSINPETGLPEFGWLKKTIKKISRGAKKIGKSVVKAVKKVAPIVLPMVLAPFMGPIWAGAVGSGIGTLIQTGNVKDAFKAALIGAGTGALTAGIGSKLNGGEFFKGISSAANPANFTEGLKGVGRAFTGDFSGASMNNLRAGPTAEGGTAFSGPTAEAAPFDTSNYTVTPDQAKTAVTDVTSQATSLSGTTETPYTFDGARPFRTGVNLPSDTVTLNGQAYAPVESASTFDMSTLKQPPGYTETPGVMDSLKDAFNFGEGRSFTESMGDIFMPNTQTPTATEFIQANQGMDLATAKQLAADAATKAPGLLRTFGPGAALALGAGAAGGAFTAPEQEDLSEMLGPTGEETLAADRDYYGLDPNRSYGSRGPVLVRPRDPRLMEYLYGYQDTEPVTAAQGGPIFPRRNGGIMPDEGVAGRDSVKAMLMPGEFVMTTNAVKGLGNGDNRQGINRMYDLMRNLEARGKAFA